MTNRPAIGRMTTIIATTQRPTAYAPIDPTREPTELESARREQDEQRDDQPQGEQPGRRQHQR